MRRDYFTCVFLGLIAGALAFVFFSPLYFTYEGIVPRDFTIFERCMSFLYAVFFVLFLPCYAAFKKKEWINWGLAAYGIFIYLPLWFYPTEKLASEDPGLLTKLGAFCLRTIYNVMEAPFAALSKLLGNTAAPRVVYWILPLAIFWPIIFRIVRFYRLAYLSEQLNPMTPDQAAQAPAFYFSGTSTGISNVAVDSMLDQNAPMYNLAGQRVSNDYKGIVVKNGRKYLAK